MHRPNNARSLRSIFCTVGVALIALVASPSRGHAGSTLTMWAETTINISGNSHVFCGWAHTNGSGDVKGSGTSMTGPFEYVSGFKSSNQVSITPVQVAPTAMPLTPHNVAYYRSLAQAQGTYHAGSFTISQTGGTLSGVLFAEGDLQISGSSITGAVTLVSATGSVTLNGSNNTLSAGADGVLAFSATRDVTVSSTTCTYSGGMYSPASSFNRSKSDDSEISGPIIANLISWSGGSNHVGGQCCSTTTNCSDTNACTNDTCNLGACDHVAIPGCVTCSTAAECNDNNACTTEACVGGRCQSNAVANGTACGDGNACNGAETCQAGACTAGTPLGCGDGNVCTDDTCNPGTGCVHTPVAGRACDNATVCDGHETCDTAGTCQPGTGLTCDDTNPCTADTCDPATGCQHAPVTDGTACGDGNACNGTETCQAGACTAGTGLTCDDQDACTTDACDAVTGCTHATILGCRPCTASADCEDGNACTLDACTRGICERTEVSPCALCTTARDCPPAGACTTATCQQGVCGTAPVADCTPCELAADCSDGNGCTVDTCDGSICAHTAADGCVACATASDCRDADGCTVDQCTPDGVCENQPTPGCIACTTVADCDDHDPCTTEACGANGRCEITAIAGCTRCALGVACDDQNACTTDTCTAGACTHAPIPGCTACTPSTELCNDGIDNDCDQLTDCADPNCVAAPNCQPQEICGDCFDNDGDGLVDFDDPDCCAQTVDMGLGFLRLRSAGQLDRVRVSGTFAKIAPAVFDPLTQDTSVQLADANSALLCANVAASHFARNNVRSVGFLDNTGAFAAGLSSGRFTVTKRGRVTFRTHGPASQLLMPAGHDVRVTVRVGAVCSRTTTVVRQQKAALVYRARPPTGTFVRGVH